MNCKINRYEIKIGNIRFINNWIYRGHWSNLFYYFYKKDLLGTKHILLGLFGFFIFVSW